MKIEFGIGADAITEESLAEKMRQAYSYSEGDTSEGDAKRLLQFYQEIFTVVRKDWNYSKDMKRVMVGEIMSMGMTHYYDEAEFIPSCGNDVNITAYYIKKHFDELSDKAQKQFLELEAEDDYFFLLPLEGHLTLGYMMSDE